MPDAQTIVIGLGNPIMSDDAIGWHVAHALRETMKKSENSPLDVDVKEACVGGLSLAEMLVGYRRAIVIDAIITEGGVPGTVYHLGLSDLPGTLNSASAHDTNLSTALAALRRFGADVPDGASIEFVAIEAQDVWTFSEACTPAVEKSIPRAVATVLQALAGD